MTPDGLKRFAQWNLNENLFWYLPDKEIPINPNSITSFTNIAGFTSFSSFTTKNQ